MHYALSMNLGFSPLLMGYDLEDLSIFREVKKAPLKKGLIEKLKK